MIAECKIFIAKPTAERAAIMKKAGVKKCPLQGHIAKVCKNNSRREEVDYGKKHHTLLYLNQNNNPEKIKEEQDEANAPSKDTVANTNIEF